MSTWQGSPDLAPAELRGLHLDLDRETPAPDLAPVAQPGRGCGCAHGEVLRASCLDAEYTRIRQADRARERGAA